jgi:hypothetical protein
MPLRVITRGLPVALLVVLAHPAEAEPPGRFEVSSLVGAHFFASNVELGVPNAPGTPHPRHSALLGGRLLYQFRKDFAIEAEVGFIPTTDSLAGDRLRVFAWRAHLVVPLGYEWGPLKSSLGAGGGGLTVRGPGDGTRHDRITNDTDLLVHWGVTGRLTLSPEVSLRLDLRHLLVPSTGDRRITNDFEAHAGVAFRFGP